MSNQHKVNHSLLRPQTFLGCDRELCMCLCLICITLGIFNFSIGMVIFLAIVFVVSYLLLIRMAKEDLLYRKVLLKSFKYKQRYVAQAYKYSKTHKHYK